MNKMAQWSVPWAAGCSVPSLEIRVEDLWKVQPSVAYSALWLDRALELAVTSVSTSEAGMADGIVTTRCGAVQFMCAVVYHPIGLDGQAIPTVAPVAFVMGQHPGARLSAVAWS